jgi:large subunit ribosomal protein L22
MADKKTKGTETAKEHLARASAQNLSVSTKHCVEICRYLRYKSTSQAKKILEEVIKLKKAIPFKRYNRDVGHKPGMAAGRFPRKAAAEVLKLIKSVEANAQFKGLNTSSLKITKILANKAAIPLTGGRQRTGTKRTHLEIEVKETRAKEKQRTREKKELKKAEAKKTEAKKENKEEKETAKQNKKNEKTKAEGEREK